MFTGGKESEEGGGWHCVPVRVSSYCETVVATPEHLCLTKVKTSKSFLFWGLISITEDRFAPYSPHTSLVRFN